MTLPTHQNAKSAKRCAPLTMLRFDHDANLRVEFVTMFVARRRPVTSSRIHEDVCRATQMYRGCDRCFATAKDLPPLRPCKCQSVMPTGRSTVSGIDCGNRT